MSTLNSLNIKTIPISTQTIIVRTNINVNIGECFKHLPITKYIKTKKKRGRKTYIEKVDYNKDVKSGSIITLKHNNEIRGVNLTNKKKKMNRKCTHFRNALTIVIVLKEKKSCEKRLNLKLSNNGKFQITGSKKMDHSIQAIKIYWNYIQQLKKRGLNVYTFKNKNECEFSAIFKVVMTNIDFNVGYRIHREHLDEYINTHIDSARSLFESNFGYTGVNIKFPLNEYHNIQLPKIYTEKNKWKHSNVTYNDYKKNILTPEECKKESAKTSYNTFLVFQSGNIIMSGRCKAYMTKVFNEFLNILKTQRSYIEFVPTTN